MVLSWCRNLCIILVFSPLIKRNEKIIHGYIELIYEKWFGFKCNLFRLLFLPAQSWDAFSYSLLVQKASFC